MSLIRRKLGVHLIVTTLSIVSFLENGSFHVSLNVFRIEKSALSFLFSGTDFFHYLKAVLYIYDRPFFFG